MNNKKRKPTVAMTPRQENILLKVVIVLVILAFLWMLFAPNTGFFSLLRQRSELKSLQLETQELVEQNEEMREEIKRIEADTAYLEEIARRDYNLVKENEIIFQFPTSKKKEKKE